MSVTVDSHDVAVVSGHYGFGDLDPGVVTLLYDANGNTLWPDNGSVFHKGGALFAEGHNDNGSLCFAWRDDDGTVTVAGAGDNGMNWLDLAVVRYKS
jgi:hypothetical protein